VLNVWSASAAIQHRRVILVDTAVWIDHFPHNEPHLAELLNEARVLMYPFVRGELAMGQPAPRFAIIEALAGLPTVETGTDAEVRLFIEQQNLFGRGIGYIDAHLLTAIRLTPGTYLWTRDKKLAAAAREMQMAYIE
jgi:predicted nucleic acid-binding protein